MPNQKNQSLSKEEEIEEFKVFLRRFVGENEVERMATEVRNNWEDFEGSLLQQSAKRH